MPLLLLGLGTVELVVLLLIFLVLFGSRLPKAAGNIGASIKEFKKGMKEASEERVDRDDVFAQTNRDSNKPAKTDAEKT